MKRCWLAERRQELGIKSAEMASLLKMTPGFYSLIENGERYKRMPMETAVQLAKILRMPLQDIIDREGIV